MDDIVTSIRQSGAIEESIVSASRFVDKAKSSAEVVPDPGTRDMLFEVAEFALRRLK
jgi:geranylgeranyl pyrophosphate synthase